MEKRIYVWRRVELNEYIYLCAIMYVRIWIALTVLYSKRHPKHPAVEQLQVWKLSERSPIIESIKVCIPSTYDRLIRVYLAFYPTIYN